MTKGELAFVQWLTQRAKSDPARVPVSIGDDAAVINVGAEQIIITTDMLLDGVHFDTSQHSLDRIGAKAIACSLSDCAAMAAKPIAATVSVALPNAMPMADAQTLFDAMQAKAQRYDCPLVGGDTTSWSDRLAIDVTMLARPALEQGPVLRSTARRGDTIFVTGTLGGSIRGKHLDFEPALDLVDILATLPPHTVRAMMDISDGLSLDLFRLCQASNVGATLNETALINVISDDAKALAQIDGLDPLQHAMTDGEDFELLLVGSDALAKIAAPIGHIVDGAGVTLVTQTGRAESVQPKGYEHFQ
jgi:thiamine-monophosphate kinase